MASKAHDDVPQDGRDNHGGVGEDTTSQQPPSKIWDEFAGLNQGSLFLPPPWVDTSKPPGTTSQVPPPRDGKTWWRDVITGAYIVFSPNLVWLCMAAFVYVVFPYDYDVAKEWDAAFGRWIASRAALNLSMVLLYYGFWHAALYWLGWAERPFSPSRKYRWGKLLHNVYYTALGTIQWTAWEAIVLHCYATGRLPYLSDEEALASPLYGAAQFAVWIIAVPLYRDIHFYFAHRLIHVRAIFKYVHSLHHRNTDVEPFSGLCMHPVEHLYYFTSIGPSLYFYGTPFGFLFNGVHLIISPGAAHSGYEDHWHADQHHYLHHRYFECNYGTASTTLLGTFIDEIFGTFRDRIATKSDTYKGGADGVGAVASATHDAKATLAGWPDLDQLLFNVLFCVAAPLFLACAIVGLAGADGVSLDGPVRISNAHLVAALVTLGPVVVSILLLLLSSQFKSFQRRGAGKKQGTLRRDLSYPFHKESFVGKLGLHLVVGFILVFIPAYHMIHMVLSEPEEGAFFSVRKIFSLQ